MGGAALKMILTVRSKKRKEERQLKNKQKKK